jgi:probable phosphoglycerate mutase
MTCTLVLCRHGNTFNPGEKVVMVGASQDLALTPVGKAQALAVGQALIRLSLLPRQIITGPLRRTQEYAQIISELIGGASAVKVDPRLTEIDYGAWGGLSDDEISQQWGEAVLRRWQVDGIRPQGVTFMPSEQELESEVQALLRDCALFEGVTLVVTSNGRLRELSRIISGAPSKVRTGNVSLLSHGEQGAWQILRWDCAPESL